MRQLSEFAEPETDNPEYLAALLDARFLVGDRSVFDRSVEACRAAESPWREPMRAALIDLARQRHGQFNHTVFQLEPDIKDAPGGLRDATAIRLLAGMTPGRAGRAVHGRGTPGRGRGLHVAGALDSAHGARAQRQRPGPRDAGDGRASLRLAGRTEAPPGRIDDEHLLPPCAADRPLDGDGAQVVGGARGQEPDRHPDRRRPRARLGRRPIPRRHARFAPAAELAATVRSGAGTGRRRLRAGAHVHRTSRRTLRARELLSFRGGTRPAAPRAAPAAGSLCPALRDARTRPARPHVPRVPEGLLPRRARLLPQVHRRRAHAPDHPQRGVAVRAANGQPQALRRRAARAGAARAARARPALPRRRQVDQQEPLGRRGGGWPSGRCAASGFPRSP